MMEPVLRLVAGDASAVTGRVRLDLEKTLWNGTMIFGGLGLAMFYTNWTAVILGLSLTYITLLLGHSVGMHRMMIHRAFKAKPWLKRALIYLGALVGIGGPSKIIKIHDVRDWAQRQTECHDFFSHDRGFFRDLSWQLFYKFEFETPPRIEIEDELTSDPFIQHLDKYWRWHQLVLAICLLMIGGISFVVWCVMLRVAVSTIGHWSVTYFCHNPGPGRWRVKEAGVQASNLQLPDLLNGWLTHGECWHNNHHAFPESARIGLDKGQVDPAWLVIKTLSQFNLVWDVGVPRSDREDLIEKPIFPTPEKHATSPV